MYFFLLGIFSLSISRPSKISATLSFSVHFLSIFPIVTISFHALSKELGLLSDFDTHNFHPVSALLRTSSLVNLSVYSIKYMYLISFTSLCRYKMQY